MRPDALTAQLLAIGPFERASAPFRLLEVSGPAAGDFLQRLCTQDVLGLAQGQVKPAAFLDNKGKVLATCLVFRIAETFYLETQKEQEEQLAGLLERYHFTEKLAIARASVGRPREVVAAARNAEQDCKAERRGVVLVRFARRGVAWTRTYGGTVFVGDPDTEEGKRKPLSRELAECLRMGAGLVRVGLETEPSTLALEADLEDHCSTTKGCYTGQEIVARINTYGHVNRRLCLLHMPEGPQITAPVALHEPDDQAPVGRVMHAVPVPDFARRVGLGYLPKDFQKIGTKLALPDGVGVTVVGFAPAKP
jgi:folate-binding protein YgfZ